MATSEILTFASSNIGTNLLTQAEYAADAQRSIGHQPGGARDVLANKAMRQASIMAAGLADFIAFWQTVNITDSLTVAQVRTFLGDAILGRIGAFSRSFDLQAGHQILPGGLIWQWGRYSLGAPAGALQAITYSIAFPTALIAAWVGVDNAAGQMVGSSNRTLTGMNIVKGNSDSFTREGNWLIIGY